MSPAAVGKVQKSQSFFPSRDNDFLDLTFSVWQFAGYIEDAFEHIQVFQVF